MLKVPHLVLLCSFVLLQACGTLGADSAKRGPGAQEIESVVAVGAPTSGGICPSFCNVGRSRLITLLERGHKALTRGEYDKASKFFQAYRRAHPGRAASWEVEVAEVYMASLPGSPFYNPVQARIAAKALSPLPIKPSSVHSSSLLLHQMLEVLLKEQRDASSLKAQVKTLKNDIAVREAALKRLRELTLGQQVGGL